MLKARENGIVNAVISIFYHSPLTTHHSPLTKHSSLEQQSEHIKHTPLTKPEWENSIPDINGLILAGGESRRMGKDKSTIEYRGIPQHEYLLQLLSGFVSKVYLSCHPNRIPETKKEIITDTFLDLGPYGGVLSAFRFNPNTAWLTVPCDMPLVDDKIIAQLIEYRDPSKIATCFHDPSTGFPEPLLTIWEPRAYPILLEFLSQGFSCLRKVLINTDSKKVEIRNPHLLRNANTPEEAEILRKLL